MPGPHFFLVDCRVHLFCFYCCFGLNLVSFDYNTIWFYSVAVLFISRDLGCLVGSTGSHECSGHFPDKSKNPLFWMDQHF